MIILIAAVQNMIEDITLDGGNDYNDVKNMNFDIKINWKYLRKQLRNTRRWLWRHQFTLRHVSKTLLR